MQVATAVATSSWVAAVQPLLSSAPVTPDDVQLWLHLLPLVRTLLATHSVPPSTLQLLALSLQQAALPVLENKQAAQAAPSLPLALTSHADAAGMFTGTQLQLQGIELTQVRIVDLNRLGLLHKWKNLTAAVDTDQRAPACLNNGCCCCILLWAGIVSRHAYQSLQFLHFGLQKLCSTVASVPSVKIVLCTAAQNLAKLNTIEYASTSCRHGYRSRWPCCAASSKKPSC